MSKIAAAAEPIQQVAIHGISTNTWFLAAIALINALGLSGALTWWIRGRSTTMKIELDADAALRGEYAEHLENVKADVQRLLVRDEEKGRRLTIAETKISQQDSQIGQLRFLLSLMNAELERVSPGNAIARQVRIMMDDLQAQTTMSSNAEETGQMADIMSKLCVTKGPGE